MTDAIARRLRQSFEREQLNAEYYSFCREKLRRNKRKMLIPLAYNLLFTAILILSSIYFSAQFARASGGILNNPFIGLNVGLTIVFIGIVVAVVSGLYYIRVPFTGYALIVIFILLLLGGITSIGGQELYYGGEKFAEKLPEMKDTLRYVVDYSTPLIVLSVIGIALNIYGQFLVYEFQFIASLDGYPSFLQRMEKKKYIPVGYVPPKMRRTDIDPVEVVSVDAEDTLMPDTVNTKAEIEDISSLYQND